MLIAARRQGLTKAPGAAIATWPIRPTCSRGQPHPGLVSLGGWFVGAELCDASHVGEDLPEFAYHPDPVGTASSSRLRRAA